MIVAAECFVFVGACPTHNLFYVSTILGVQCKDGIILGTEKIVTNKMMMPGTDKRLYSIALNCGGVINGLTPDGRSIIQKAREECTSYKDQFHIKIPGSTLADRLALKFHMSTVYANYRPIGTSIIFGIHDTFKGTQLFMVEPSGACF